MDWYPATFATPYEAKAHSTPSCGSESPYEAKAHSIPSCGSESPYEAKAHTPPLLRQRIALKGQKRIAQGKRSSSERHPGLCRPSYATPYKGKSVSSEIECHSDLREQIVRNEVQERKSAAIDY